MSKHHSKHHHESEGARLIGSPEELINLLITGESEKNWALNELVNEGPKHKQVLSALLLNRLYKLLVTLQNSNGKYFELQDGFSLPQYSGKEEILFPVEIPVNLGPDADKEKIIESISKAPKHEALLFAMALQIIEWAITSITVEEPVAP